MMSYQFLTIWNNVLCFLIKMLTKQMNHAFCYLIYDVLECSRIFPVKMADRKGPKRNQNYTKVYCIPDDGIFRPVSLPT